MGDEKIREDLQKYERIPDIYIKDRKFYNPKTYISIQDRVNSDPEFERFYFKKLIDEGWYKLETNLSITDKNLSGRYFKYRLNGTGKSGAERGIFRSGGILLGTQNNDNAYILYKAYNGCIFSLQVSDLLEVYIRDPKVPNNKTVTFKTPTVKTNYPVFLQNPKTGKQIPVYYAKDSYNKDRFLLSKKYEYAYTTNDWKFD